MSICLITATLVCNKVRLLVYCCTSSLCRVTGIACALLLGFALILRYLNQTHLEARSSFGIPHNHNPLPLLPLAFPFTGKPHKQRHIRHRTNIHYRPGLFVARSRYKRHSRGPLALQGDLFPEETGRGFVVVQPEPAGIEGELVWVGGEGVGVCEGGADVVPSRREGCCESALGHTMLMGLDNEQRT